MIRTECFDLVKCIHSIRETILDRLLGLQIVWKICVSFADRYIFNLGYSVLKSQVYVAKLCYFHFCRHFVLLFFNKNLLSIFFLISNMHSHCFVLSIEISIPEFPVILYPGHFLPRKFRTNLVISYPLYFHFGNSVPSFVISYPVWSFHTHFFIIIKIIWSFGTQFLHSRVKVIWYPESFRSHFSNFVPRYRMSWVRIDFFLTTLGT